MDLTTSGFGDVDGSGHVWTEDIKDEESGAVHVLVFRGVRVLGPTVEAQKFRCRVDATKKKSSSSMFSLFSQACDVWQL